MFRIESYVTSIILSYVDRYIKNFRLQDAQVSLWEGDGVFHNLDLDLEVLEQELNLPFTFVSGHINELMIHVPWTRINSSPVRITINTIECVIKLRSPGARQTPTSERVRKPQPQKPDDSTPMAAPPTYTSHLVNKIICNLSVTCNNFILKYVEEDIVFSMNIKTLNLESVNSKWEPAFLDLSPSQLVLRKLISLSDVTICLDKRNASGRIESYMEPLLYRCFLTMRLSQTYPSVNASRASSTRLDIYCEKMAFTLSEPQVPMLIRMCALALALQKKQLTPKLSITALADNPQDNTNVEDVLAIDPQTGETWSNWVWNWVPTLPFLAAEEGQNLQPVQSQTLQFGFYIDVFTLALKLCNMTVDLQGCLMELESHDTEWTNVQMGISHMNIVPSGDCCCGTSEQNQLPYLTCGTPQCSFLSDSLFGDSTARKVKERSWDYHIATVTEALLLEKTPAFAVDYLFVVQTPQMSEFDDEDDDDEERIRQPVERVLMRHVADGVVIRICSGLIHRTQMILKSASTYDYVPYTTQYQVPEKSVESFHEFDHLGKNLLIPQYMARFTLFRPSFEIYPANHSPVQPSSLGRKLSRSQKRAQQASSSVLPTVCVVVEWSCLDAKLTRPLNPDKVAALSSIFENIPNELISDAETRLSLKVVGVTSSMRLPSVEPMKILEISSVSLDWSLQPLISLPKSIVVTKVDTQIEQLMLTLSNPKLLLLYETINSLIMSNNKQRYQSCFDTLFSTSLIQDASASIDMVYLKVNLDRISIQWVQTGISECVQVCVDACQAFVMQIADKAPNLQTMILVAPNSNENKPLMTGLFQRPLENETKTTVEFQGIIPPHPSHSQSRVPHGPVLMFCVHGIRISIDPLLYTWLLYSPLPVVPPFSRPSQTQLPHVTPSVTAGSSKSRKVSEGSSSAHKRALTPQESVHSSSERETSPSVQLSQPITEFIKEPSKEPTFIEKVSSLYPVWQSIVVCGDISDLCIYFPNSTLCSQLPQPMESSLQTGLKKSPQLQVAVLKVPSTTLLCSSLKHTPFQLPLPVLPVILPQSIWSPEKCNFPWSLKITDLQCYTLHGSVQLKLLKPLSATCTVGVSTKYNGSMLTSLALCVHLDTTAISISISEEQVALLVGLAVIHAQVLQTLLPVSSADVHSTEDILLSVEPPIGSDDSLSISQLGDENSEGAATGVVKLTGWMQWTLARFTLTVYNQPSKVSPESLKLTLDVEDIFFSLDIERVYHKLKFKVSTASIQHYCRSSSNHPWVLGPFQGLVMRGYDPDGVGAPAAGLPTDDSASNSSGFLTATLTRACCSNLHSKLGTPSKATKLLQKGMAEDKFVTEIAVKLQPLDIVLSPNTIGTILNVLNPLLKVPQHRTPRPVIQPLQQKSLTMFTSSSLPLLYLDLMAVRIVLPAGNVDCQHDVILIQFDGVTTSPQPENPICRIPVRLDIYQAAEKHRILNVPGSEIEDRQYQVDIVALTISTGMWSELKSMLLKDAVPSLQNPALDWNEGRRPSAAPTALETMLTVIPAFNICFVVAPAIVYRDKVVVCGHSVEVNAVSEVMVTISTDQIELCGVLANEISNVLPAKLDSDESGVTNVPLWIPQPQIHPLPLQFESIDSGLETFSGSTQPVAKKGDSDVHTLSGRLALSTSPAPSGQPTITTFSSFTKRAPSKERFVPLEILITGAGISCSLCKIVNGGRFSDVLPLLHLRISQPHVFIAKLGETKKFQASVYDLSVRCGKSDNPVIVSQNRLSAKDFLQSLFETRSGDPHPKTGIPPALLTMKWIQTGSKPIKLDIDLGRPIRITVQVDIIEFLKNMKSDVITRWNIGKTVLKHDSDRVNEDLQDNNQEVKNVTIGTQQQMSSQLKNYFSYFSTISLSSQKILLAILTRQQNTGNVGVSVDKITLNSVIAQHTITSNLLLEALSVSTQLANKTKLLLNPWSLSVKIVLLWENWSPGSIFQGNINSEVLSVDISPRHIQCLQHVQSEFFEYFQSSSPASSNTDSAVHSELPKPLDNINGFHASTESDQQEQHYKEDLQAGAFQFIDGVNDQEDLPLIYQVVFSTGVRRNPTMAWRYPQPRALTRLHIQPLPFRDSEPGDTVGCVLQYWSDSHSAYKDYINFSLCESAACTVALPTHDNSIPLVAATWRVVLGVGSNPDPLPVNVKALAACLRVDSYFCPTLVPNVQIAVTISTSTLTLWADVTNKRPMPAELSRYVSDGCLPLSHLMLTLTVNQSDLAFSSWTQGTRQIVLNCTLRLDVLNYRTLNLHTCIEPFQSISCLYLPPDSAKSLRVVSDPITCRIGPSVCHTLATASQLWTQYSTNVPYHFIVVTPYVVCNNSCLPIRFGQVDTDEIISLHCLQCHLYSWRSTKCPLSLKFSLALPDGSSRWSKPIQPLKEGSVCITVCDEESRDWNLVITMKRVTNFLMQVTVAGQLLITNNSDSNVELLISSERQNSLVVPAQSTPPGVILSPHFLPFLRIRYPGISFTWSGVVSLKCDGTNSKKWLVKIPLQDKNSFRSLWCHIMWDKDRETGRILVVLNSMFKIMSNLPCGAVVKLQTPELEMTQMVSVKGQGDIQDLNCPGTPNTSHKLTFQLDGRIQSSSPEVPLSYLMVENDPPASSKHSPVDINSLLEKALLPKTQNTCWPLPSSEWGFCNWSSAAQPDTIVHVKVVQGKEWIEPTSLQVELQPWALLLNSVGCHISLQSSDRFTCSLPHLSVLAPPTLESTFHLGLYIGTSVYLSNSLQLSRDKAFYMPHISGLIPLTGHMNTMVDCDSVVSFVNILSTEVNNVRIIHIRSSFVIANFSSKVLKVAAVVVGRNSDIKKQYILPPNIDYNSFTLKPQKSAASTYNKAFPITEWICMSKVTETMVPYVAVSEGGDYSCPIEVPQSADRQSTALLVPSAQPALPNHVNSMLLLCSEQRDGQTFLTIWDQPYPAFTIHNLTRSMVIFAKAFNEKGGVAVPFSPDWEWQLRLPSGCSADYQLPGEIEPDTASSEKVPVAVIATDYRGIKGGFNWSEGIALTTCRGKQVHIPGTSDITVAIMKRGFTTHVTLSHASNTEISPLDVRSRLTKEAQLANEADSYEKFAVPSTSSGIRHRSQEHFSFEEQFVTATSKTEGGKSGLEDIHCFVRGLTLIFAVEGELACDCREISAFVFDNIALTCLPSAPPVRDSDVKELLIRLTLGDMQLDNQLYNTGGYDFPVILMTKIRETNEQHPLQFSISAPAFSMVEMSRVNGSAMDLVLTLDVNSYKTPVLQDVSVTFAPMIIYIEDLYLLELKDHLMKAMPAYTLTDSVFDITKEKYLLPNSLNLQNSDSISEGIGNTLNKQNLRNNDDDRVMFFNLKQNISDELDDDKEELFNVSEPDVDIQGFGLLPEVNLGNDDVDKKEDDAKENKQVKEILFESDLPWIQPDIYVDREEIEETVDMYDIPIPKEVIIAAQELAYPLRLRSLTISPLVVLVSLHTSTTFYIGLDHSPLNFSSFHRGNLVTTAYRLGHALTLHYFLGAFYGSAWAIVSLEMLGAPGGLARTVTSGLRDFVSLPYQGIQQGPRAFLTGIAHGSASLMRHVTAGTLTSVTKMAASWARTLDRLTLTQEDLRRTEEARRSRPQGVTQGFMHGLTEFGISLLGAMGSLVHQPLQYAVSPRPNQSLVNSIGLGVMGVFTRPLSGAAELVALTGEGLLSGAGWSNLPRARIQPKAQHVDCGTESMLLHSWKILQNSEQLLLTLEASRCSDYQPAVLLLTRSNLYIMQSEKLIKCISLSDLRVSAHHSDPTLIFMRIVPLEAEAEALLRARLDQFVRDSQRVCGAESEIFSPPSTSAVDQNNETEPSICYFVNPQMREYFITFVTFARRHAIGQDFPLVS